MSNQQTKLKRKSFQDLTGKKFGRLFVLSYNGVRNGTNRWNCICECRNIKNDVRASSLIRCKSNFSCGCYVKEVLLKRSTTHNLSKTHLYKTWIAIKNRTLCESSSHYDNYGARGIDICERWLGINGFENFSKDMGNRPSNKYSIDRINVNKGYSPDNCRWATTTQQARNRRNNTILTYNGQSLTIKEWSEITHINASTISKRLEAGWNVPRIINEPVHLKKKRR